MIQPCFKIYCQSEDGQYLQIQSGDVDDSVWFEMYDDTGHCIGSIMISKIDALKALELTSDKP